MRQIPDSLLPGLLEEYRSGEFFRSIQNSIGVGNDEWRSFRKKHKEAFDELRHEHTVNYQKIKYQKSINKHRDNMNYQDYLNKQGVKLNKYETI